MQTLGQDTNPAISDDVHFIEIVSVKSYHHLDCTYNYIVAFIFVASLVSMILLFDILLVSPRSFSFLFTYHSIVTHHHDISSIDILFPQVSFSPPCVANPPGSLGSPHLGWKTHSQVKFSLSIYIHHIKSFKLLKVENAYSAYEFIFI